MYTFKELGEKYANNLKSNPSINNANNIANKINNLVYENTDRKLVLNDKMKIVKEIELAINYSAVNDRLLKEADNKEHLSLINYVNEIIRQGN
ncbi:hypothetical protein BLD48_02265 [Exiguobacterium sp. KRL4]|uniref:hypothetical protein n=1 Tax=Exiguobacterium sp. KRL4 TaxID=1914536 RepID=UPI0008F91C14|nr:hypothetical protein [Exiguobacterium sp. KRL4]OIN68147.1 hypothetical protein BLD48_02265 [Exiguobacterium sp. KRL4]